MKKITDSKILQEKTDYNLQSKVKEQIKLGWQPFGGVAISTYGIEYFYQAMVRYEN